MSSECIAVEELLKQGDLELVQDGNHGGSYPKIDEFVADGVPLITGACLIDGGIDYTKSGFISLERASRLRVGFAKPGDILLTHKGTMGKTALVPKSKYPNTILNPQITLYRVAPHGRLDARYLKFFFDSQLFQNFLVQISATSTINTLPIKEQKKLEIPLPSRLIQEEIVGILGALDDRIALLRETNATLEAIAQAMFKSWFVDFDPVHAKQQGRAPEGMSVAIPTRGTPVCAPGVPPDPSAAAALFPDSFEESELGLVPRGWKVEPLTEVFDFREGPGIRNWQYTNTDQGTRFINIRCIQDGDLSIETANRITDEEANGKYAHFHLKVWDVVVSTSGTLGRSAIVRQEHLPLMLNTSVIRFQPIEEKMRFSFVYEYLNSTEFLFKLESMASGSVQKNFGPMHLKQMKLVCPPIDLLAHYESICRPLFEKVVANRARIQTLATLRDTLLPRLISGQLRLPQAALEEA